MTTPDDQNPQNPPGPNAAQPAQPSTVIGDESQNTAPNPAPPTGAEPAPLSPPAQVTPLPAETTPPVEPAMAPPETTPPVAADMAPPETTPAPDNASPVDAAQPPLVLGQKKKRLTLKTHQPDRPQGPIRSAHKAITTPGAERAKSSGLAALGLAGYQSGQKPADPGPDMLGAAQRTAPAQAAATQAAGSHANAAEQAAQTAAYGQTSWPPGPAPDGADEATRAAYAVAAQEMLAGEAVAKELAGTAAIARAQDVPTLLNRLLETYSDLGAVFIQLVAAAVEQGKAAAGQTGALGAMMGQPGAQAPAAAAQAAPAGGSIAVQVTASTPVTAHALLYGAVSDAPAGTEMLRTGGGANLPAPVIAPGPVVHITVQPDAAPGVYNGFILSAKDSAPAGTITLTIPEPN